MRFLFISYGKSCWTLVRLVMRMVCPVYFLPGCRTNHRLTDGLIRDQTDLMKTFETFSLKKKDIATLHSHRLSKPGSTFHPQASFDWNLSSDKLASKDSSFFWRHLGDACATEVLLRLKRQFLVPRQPYCYIATLLHCYTATLLLCCTATLLNPGAAAAVSSELENVKPMFGRCVRLSD